MIVKVIESATAAAVSATLLEIIITCLSAEEREEKLTTLVAEKSKVNQPLKI